MGLIDRPMGPATNEPWRAGACVALYINPRDRILGHSAHPHSTGHSQHSTP